MSWSEIKKAVNSDLNKPLDTLIKELLTDTAKETSVDEVESLLKNSTYGLGAIKNAIGSSSGGGTPVQLSNFNISIDEKTSNFVSSLPYPLYGQGNMVVINDEIHITGSDYSSGYSKYHYKWNGSSWTSVSTIPFYKMKGGTVLLNGQIHILDGNNQRVHYKWDGSSWTSVSTLPYSTNGTERYVVLNNKIHMMGQNGSNSKSHYKWNGSSWTSVSTLPYNFASGEAVVLNGEIYLIGGYYNSSYQNYLYKWDGTNWYKLGGVPHIFEGGSSIVLNGQIHLLGGVDNNYGYSRQHYKWDGYEWVDEGTIYKDNDSTLYNFYKGSAVILNGEIHLMGGIEYPQVHQRITNTQSYRAYLPSGVKIHFDGVTKDAITTVTGCSVQTDGTISVTSSGLVKFKIKGSHSGNYSIY